MSTPDMEAGLDEEGQEVLAELEAEGFEIAGREPKVEEPAAEKTEEQTEVKTAKVESKPEPKPAEEPKVDPKTDVKSDEGKGEESARPERKPQYVPLAKYLDTETALKEAREKIDELSKAGSESKPTTESIADATEAVQKLVEQFNYSEDEAQALIGIVSSLIPGQKLPAEVQEQLSKLGEMTKDLESRRESLRQQEEAQAFETDFLKLMSEFPHLSKFKDSIKEKAYSEDNIRVPLRTLAIEFMHDEGISFKPGPVKTAEEGGGGIEKSAEEIDFSTITDEQFAKLTPEQQDQFFAYQEKREKQARGALN